VVEVVVPVAEATGDDSDQRALRVEARPGDPTGGPAATGRSVSTGHASTARQAAATIVPGKVQSADRLNSERRPLSWRRTIGVAVLTAPVEHRKSGMIYPSKTDQKPTKTSIFRF